MRKLALFIILCIFTIFTDYSLTQTKEPAPIPTFYNGKWVVVDVERTTRLCPWVEINFGFPSLVNIRIRFAIDTYIYKECWFDGIDCMKGRSTVEFIPGRCDD